VKGEQIRTADRVGGVKLVFRLADRFPEKSQQFAKACQKELSILWSMQPTLSALARFRSMKVEFEIREARTPVGHAATRPPDPDACVHFDMSFV
jgi:hypothetical protein